MWEKLIFFRSHTYSYSCDAVVACVMEIFGAKKCPRLSKGLWVGHALRKGDAMGSVTILLEATFSAVRSMMILEALTYIVHTRARQARCCGARFRRQRLFIFECFGSGREEKEHINAQDARCFFTVRHVAGTRVLSCLACWGSQMKVLAYVPQLGYSQSVRPLLENLENEAFFCFFSRQPEF